MKKTEWARLGVQRRPISVSGLLHDVSNITVATGHRYVWRGVKNASYLLHSSLHRRLDRACIPVTKANLVAYEADLLKQARDAGFAYRDGRELSPANLLALLQHAGASTTLLDVTPDPFVALFFATEPVGPVEPCALIAIKIPGKTEKEQLKRTFKGPLGISKNGYAYDGREGFYDEVCSRLALPSDVTDPLLWEAPFVDDRMRAQRGMFLATTSPPSDVSFASFGVDLDDPDKERNRVKNLCERAKGKWNRPPLVVFYISSNLRIAAARELDRRFGYRTETIYPDLAGFATANASNRPFHALPA
jgi:hypothetical protein